MHTLFTPNYLSTRAKMYRSLRLLLRSLGPIRLVKNNATIVQNFGDKYNLDECGFFTTQFKLFVKKNIPSERQLTMTIFMARTECETNEI